MSSVENEKENKKPGKEQQQQSKMKSNISMSIHGGKDVTKRLPTIEAVKKALSPRKPKSRGSREASSTEMASEAMDTTENDEEPSASTQLSDLSQYGISASTPITRAPPPTPPPTHFSTVTVEINDDVRNFMKTTIGEKQKKFINRNMVVGKVPTDLMSHFMPGDQICRIGGVGVWNIQDLVGCLTSTFQESATVIRAWNIRCITPDLITKLNPDENRHYFIATAYASLSRTKNVGIKVGTRRKRVVVTTIFSNTPMSTALLVGDEILGVGDTILEGSKKEKKKQVMTLIKYDLNKQGFVEIIARRKIGSRSSPAPSLEAEQVVQYPAFADSGEKNPRLKKKKEEGVYFQLNLPLPADALEIAFRELTFLRELGLPDSDAYSLNKGPSLYDCPDSTHKSMMSSPLSPSTRTVRGKTTDTQEDPPNAIQFEKDNLSETSSITSDVPEEENLKKCDRKTAMVAYIKGKFNQKAPILSPPPPPPPK